MVLMSSCVNTCWTSSAHRAETLCAPSSAAMRGYLEAESQHSALAQPKAVFMWSIAAHTQAYHNNDSRSF